MANFVTSVEYLEITLSGTTATASLTKSQTIANCVPMGISVNYTSDINDIHNARDVEVVMEAGPQVTVNRQASTGTVIVGVHVVEFDTTGNISVQQGTWSMADRDTTAAITDVLDVTDAFVVISYDHTSNSDDWDDSQVKVVFNSTTELGFNRITNAGTAAGRYYVVVTSGTDFSVQHDTITMASTDELTTETISAVTLASSFVVKSYNNSRADDNQDSGGVVVDISTTTTVRARRAFNDFGDDTPDGAAAAASVIETQVVSAGGTEFTVERNECDWGDSLTQAVTITEIDQAQAIVIPGGYQGVMSVDQANGNFVDGGYGVLDFTSNTEVTGTRATNTNVDGTTMFEVVEFLLVVGAVPTINLVMAPYVSMERFTF